MGHFRVSLFLCFKTSLCTELRKWVCRRNTFGFERFRTKTPLGTEAQGNSEVANWKLFFSPCLHLHVRELARRVLSILFRYISLINMWKKYEPERVHASTNWRHIIFLFIFMTQTQEWVCSSNCEPECLMPCEYRYKGQIRHQLQGTHESKYHSGYKTCATAWNENPKTQWEKWEPIPQPNAGVLPLGARGDIRLLDIQD